MIVDSNDDIHIAHADTLGYYDLLFTTVQGTGKGLTPHPVFTITPNLPSGLVFNWKTGTISGTPTEVHANTTHTVTVTTLGTTTQGTLTLHVTGAPGPIAYVDLTASTGSTITPISPTLTSTATSGAVTSWAINATLPTGLTFETSNGTIWGTPSQIIADAVFTVWANNSAGSSLTTVNITINDVQVAGIAYSGDLDLTYHHTMTTATPSTTGGTPTSWAIHPSLPSGLSFDPITGAISGTPDVLQTTTSTHTVWANNSGGSHSVLLNITINDHAPAPIQNFDGDLVLTIDQGMTPSPVVEVRPDLLGAGEDHSCAIKADGTVRCWGHGGDGRLGHGGTGQKTTPTATGSSDLVERLWTSVQAGTTHVRSSMMGPCPVGEPTPTGNWAMARPRVGPLRRKRSHSHGPPSLWKRACTSPVRCWTMGPSPAGAATTTASWDEGTRTPPVRHNQPPP